jgi:hypothetical protein
LREFKICLKTKRKKREKEESEKVKEKTGITARAEGIAKTRRKANKMNRRKPKNKKTVLRSYLGCRSEK